jgi:hypothetical protein
MDILLFKAERLTKRFLGLFEKNIYVYPMDFNRILK